MLKNIIRTRFLYPRVRPYKTENFYALLSARKEAQPIAKPVSYTHLIMNQCITGWRYFPNPRMFSEYGRQKGWERENPATDSGNPSEKTMGTLAAVAKK